MHLPKPLMIAIKAFVLHYFEGSGSVFGCKGFRVSGFRGLGVEGLWGLAHLKVRGSLSGSFAG